ncbi:glycosyltransferase N-terminal domain-containing protein [Planktotalea sp.]|uniref:3-deoxy-D-manno-octulosonic acid transferase n=1 Tax=Planktotalea sp. TaxID=2029877 RepID=UPI00329850D4
MSSLSLTAYKALTRGAKAANIEHYEERPQGLLIWGVVQNDADVRSLLYLRERLRVLRGPCDLLITYPENPPYVPKSKGVFCHPLPLDTTEGGRSFLQHWRPDYCIWIGGDLQPALITEAHERKIPLSLVSASVEHLDRPVWRWLPSLARETLDAFGLITAIDANSRQMLRKMDATRREIPVTDALQDAVIAPTVNESVFDEVLSDLNNRPVWLAAQVQADEIKSILSAHREAIKITHRLTLVLVAASFPISVEARAIIKAQGWRVCYWEDGDPIDEETQIIFVEEPEHMGLWYRIAPFCFLGSTLTPGHGGNDPYVPASLGSAIIYGPNVGRHAPSFTRLVTAGAARIVRDRYGLTRSIAHLLAADQTANMAHAAWITMSEGAEATDALIEDIQERWDTVEGHP